MRLDSRQQILLEALPLFLERGVAETRTGDICKAAGVSNGSLFHFFPNKVAIAVELYVTAIGSYQGALLEEIAKERHAELTVRGIIRAHWRWVESHADEARFLFELGRPDWHAEAGKRTNELNERMEGAYADWWNGRRAEGQVVDIPFPAARAILLGPSMMALRHWLRGGAGAPHRLAKVFADAAVHSLVVEKSG